MARFYTVKTLRYILRYILRKARIKPGFFLLQQILQRKLKLFTKSCKKKTNAKNAGLQTKLFATQTKPPPKPPDLPFTLHFTQCFLRDCVFTAQRVLRTKLTANVFCVLPDTWQRLLKTKSHCRRNRLPRYRQSGGLPPDGGIYIEVL